MRTKHVVLLVAAAMGMTSCTTTDLNVEENDMHKRYTVRRAAEPIPIDADWNKPAWQGIEPITIGLYMGDKPEHLPKTQAKLAWDDEHIYVIFRVEDRYVRAITTEHQGPVSADSCVEFFFSPRKDVADGYFNLEVNCIGTILLHHRPSGHGYQALDVDALNQIQLATSLPKGEPIDPAITTPTVWTLEYALPWQMLTAYTPVTAPSPGETWRANFYKCGTSHSHFLTWSKVPLERPNFHQPTYFGYLVFTDESD